MFWLKTRKYSVTTHWPFLPICMIAAAHTLCLSVPSTWIHHHSYWQPRASLSTLPCLNGHTLMLTLWVSCNGCQDCSHLIKDIFAVGLEWPCGLVSLCDTMSTIWEWLFIYTYTANIQWYWWLFCFDVAHERLILNALHHFVCEQDDFDLTMMLHMLQLAKEDRACRQPHLADHKYVSQWTWTSLLCQNRPLPSGSNPSRNWTWSKPSTKITMQDQFAAPKRLRADILKSHALPWVFKVTRVVHMCSCRHVYPLYCAKCE